MKPTEPKETDAVYAEAIYTNMLHIYLNAFHYNSYAVWKTQFTFTIKFVVMSHGLAGVIAAYTSIPYISPWPGIQTPFTPHTCTVVTPYHSPTITVAVLFLSHFLRQRASVCVCISLLASRVQWLCLCRLPGLAGSHVHILGARKTIESN